MGKKQMLIVDSHETLLDLFKHNIQEVLPGYHNPVTVTNSVAALELLRRQPFKLIIADYDLPGMNGLEFAQAAYRLQPEAHILLMSNEDTGKIEKQAQQRHIPVESCLNKIELLEQLWECEDRRPDD